CVVLLPHFSANAVCTVHLVARLHAKCFVELRHIAQWSICAPLYRRVRVCNDAVSQFLITRVCPPHLCPAQEETLVRCKAIYLLALLSLLCFLECFVSYCQSTKVSKVF